MNKRELKDLLAALDKFDKSVTNKAAAIAALKSEGYLDESGKVSVHYAAPAKTKTKTAAAA